MIYQIVFIIYQIVSIIYQIVSIIYQILSIIYQIDWRSWFRIFFLMFRHAVDFCQRPDYG